VDPSITFFPVGCGDMALVRLADETSILVDVHIRQAADDPDDATCDVAAELCKRLKRDAKGRPYVDAFLQSHPDKDHCGGLDRHFHLGPIADYPDDDKADGDKRIVIREIWSSPLVFRRASEVHTLCPDAKAFAKEAKRRVKRYRDGISAADGERILLMGEDRDGKTDDLGAIVVRAGATFNTINGQTNSYFLGRLLAPLPCPEGEEDEALSKNQSSVIMNMQLGTSLARPDACRFLTGGDAEVLIWERMWAQYEAHVDFLKYDVLLAPHHCSWHSLSYDSWSACGEEAEVASDARSALGQARSGAFIIASSKPIKDDDADPPCIRAKREYTSMLDDVPNSMFLCVGEEPNEWSPQPLELTVTAGGLKRRVGTRSAVGAVAAAPAPKAG
jgi:hypothetical protein